MTTIIDVDLTNVKKDLVYSLTTLSNGRINDDLAFKIADQSIDNLDFNNSALVHKGTNWYAREILKSLRLI